MSAVEPIGAASAAQTEQILRVNNIEVIYDHVILVLKGVSLDVPKGGIVAAGNLTQFVARRLGDKREQCRLYLPDSALLLAIS